jgi:uncharacterized protein (DUF1697 family)
MTRYVLLLRGVNVGRNNSLPMAELCAMLAKIGCTDVPAPATGQGQLRH